MDPRFQIAKSTIRGAGRGLFAVTPLRKGDLLEVVGVAFARGSEADVCTAHADSYKFAHGDLLILPTGVAAMVNDSDTPNMKKFVKDGTLYLRAIRHIEAGEELTFKYAMYGRRLYTKKDQE
jgi:hypothetical protein